MTRRVLLVPLVLGVIMSVAGCKGDSKASNYGHIRFEIEPMVQARADNEVDFSSYKTFTVWRNPQSPDPILEKQMLFLARNMLEALGYSFTEDAAGADLLLALSLANEYHATQVPPSTIALPKYMPPQTHYGTGTWSGNVGGSYTWGSTSGTVTTPGYWTTQSFTRPGYTTGAFYPAVNMLLADPRRYRADIPQDMLVWTGIAVGTSKVSDVRMTGQMLMMRLLKDFPRSSSAAHSPGWIGAAITILTPDGNTLWPTVLDVAKGSPADKAGLRMWDIIWAVDDRSTANLPLSQFLELLGGSPGDAKKLTITRLKETSDIEVSLSAYGQPAR